MFKRLSLDVLQVQPRASRAWSQFACLSLDYVPLYKASHRQGNQILLGTFGEFETGFRSGGLCPRGLPKVVFQSPSFYVQRYVGEGVGLCSRHNLHHTDHMKINKPRIVDLRSEASFLLGLTWSCSNFLLINTGCWLVHLIKYLRRSCTRWTNQ